MTGAWTCEETRASLDDLVDGLLDGDTRARAQEHLSGCAACRAEEARLRALLAEAAALTPEVAPPVDLWPRIERRIHGSAWRVWGAKPRSGGKPPSAARRIHSGAHSMTRSAWTRHLAAAACLALAVAGALTARLPRTTGPTEPTGATLQPAALEAADVEQVERDYERAASALLVQLRARQGSLPPETVAQVEESLRTIDTALVQIRAALQQQPAEPALHLMLAATHRKKVEVLRRVMEVGA